MKTTKAFAKEVLDLWKDKSCLFNGSMTEGEFQSERRKRNERDFV